MHLYVLSLLLLRPSALPAHVMVEPHVGHETTLEPRISDVLKLSPTTGLVKQASERERYPRGTKQQYVHTLSPNRMLCTHTPYVLTHFFWLTCHSQATVVAFETSVAIPPGCLIRGDATGVCTCVQTRTTEKHCRRRSAGRAAGGKNLLRFGKYKLAWRERGINFGPNANCLLLFFCDVVTTWRTPQNRGLW